MSLFKRGKTWWTYIYRDGTRYQYSTGTSNRKRAETIETKLKEEINYKRFQIVETDPEMTFGALAARFVASPSVRPHHIYHLRFLLPYFADVPVLRLTKSGAEEFRSVRRKHNPSIKDATINRDLSVLRHILYWAVDEQLISANPLARIKMARERRTRRQVLSVAEEQLLLSATKNHLTGMVTMALDTGLRRGEITSQLWEDIDFSQNLLFVTRSKTPEGESREIPLTGRLLEFLQKYRQSQGLVFTYKGRPIRIVKRTWKTALKNAGLRHMRFHDLRHTFATRLMEAGVPQDVRMALLGHSSGSRVHSTYIHVETPVKREAIRKLEQWKIRQKQQIENQKRKEEDDASTKIERSQSSSFTDERQTGSQTVEEENTG